MKVLFITTEGFDTPGPNNQMAMKMISDFLDSNIKVHLIQSRRKMINADIPKILEKRKNLTFDIVPRKVIDKTNFVIRYLDEMMYAYTSFKKWRKVKDVDIVFLQSCPTVLYQLIMLKIFCKKPIIYNIYDIFPGHAYDIGVMKSKLIYNILNFIQKFTYKLSDVITVLSDDMKNKLIDQGVSQKKIKVVPAWYDDKFVKEIKLEENKFIKKYDIDTNKFYVQFAGTIGYVFDYKTIINTAKLLKSEKNIIFQIIGDGNVKMNFMQEAKKYNLNNIKFYPLQPLDIVPDVYSACSICIIPLPKGVIGNGVPSKAPLLMACKRAIVNSVELNSQYAKMFNDNNIGIAVQNGDSEALADAILYLYKNPKQLEYISKKAQIYGKENFTSSVNTRKFIKIFHDICGSERMK